MANTLPVSRLIQVSVTLTPQPAQGQNLSTLLVLGSSPVIDVTTRIREYADLDSVASDFGTTAPEYLAAQAYFGQSPQPDQLLIGRWALTATHGQLIGATLSAAQQDITVWNAVNSGGFSVLVDGGSVQHLSGLDFSAQTNLNGVASIINAVLSGAAILWNANFTRFEMTSTTTGATSSVAFLTAPSSGTDISTMLGMRSTSSGAYVANGIAAETALNAVVLFETSYSQLWYALNIPEAVDADHLAVAGFIEGTNAKHIYGVTTQEAGVLVASVTTDIAFKLKQLAYKRTVTQFSSSSAYAIASLLGRILTVDYNGNATVITLMYKQEPGIVAENLNTTQADAVQGKNCNVFTAYNNNTMIIQYGVVASGDYLDIITGTDWLSVDIQNELYNLLYTSPTKIPQTDAGNHQLVTTIEAVCAQAVTNGLLAPGTWQSNGFGALNTGDFMAKGFYVYAPPIASQNSSDRAARKSVPIQIACKLAGAIHTVSALIFVNR